MRMITKGGVIAALLLAFTLLPAAEAFGHAERIASRPDEGERLEEPPTTVRVDFTEPPVADPQWEVLDGCGFDVTQSVTVRGTRVEATLAAGQPGDWEVSFGVVSGIDGHATRDSFTFTVAGEPDCAAAPTPTEREESDEGGSLTFVVVIGALTAAILAGALLMRRRA